jgi:predicted permease
MSLLHALRHGLRALVRRAKVESELDDEVRHYIDEATREHLRAGMTPEDAERQARLAFGPTDALKADVRRARWETTIEAFWLDVRCAARGLRRNPGFATAASLTLALGIGASTAMFSVVNAVLLRPLPYDDDHRLALIWTDDVRRQLHREPTAYPTIADWRRGTRSFQDIAFFLAQRADLRADARSPARERTRSAFVSGNLFPLLGVEAARGRVISPHDEDAAASVAVISHSLWQRRFQGADSALGATMTIDDPQRRGPIALTIVGIMPATFYFPDKSTEIWTPATTAWRFDRVERFASWARRWTAMGRLAPGVSIDEARGGLARMSTRLGAVHTTDVADFPGFATTVVPMLEQIAGPQVRSALWILLGAVTLVLLIACVNVANLLLARGASRMREVAVRRALGAGHGRLVRQFMAESLALAAVGGALGTLLAAWGTRLLSGAASSYVPRLDEILVDVRVLAFAAVASTAAAITFGLAPALRVSSATDARTLRTGVRDTGPARLRARRGALIVVECALAAVLLAGAGLLLKSLLRLSSIDPGFDPSGVLTVRLDLPVARSPHAAEEPAAAWREERARALEGRLHALLERLHGLPGVRAAAYIDDLFVTGRGNSAIAIPGQVSADLITGELNDGAVSADFFPTMRVRLVRGRHLTRDDTHRKIRALHVSAPGGASLAEQEQRVRLEPVVVNEAFARRFFGNESPVGRRFYDPANAARWFEIVGVLTNVHRQGVERVPIPEYFGPYVPSDGGRVDLVVRVAGDPLAASATVRGEVARELPDALIADVSTVDAQLGGFTASRRFQTALLTGFAGVAVLLAVIGIYGVGRYTIAERTREIGIRITLGATPADVLSLIIWEGIRMPALGISVGLAASLALTRVMTHLLFGVSAVDPATFATVGVGLAAATLLACYLPARRATRVDPICALRQE